MELIFHIILFIFVGLILAFAITLGFSLLLWCAALGLLMTIIFTIRQRLQRWRFLKENADDRPTATIKVIEGSYTEVTDHRQP
ncbi:MAG: hypothetical protein K2Q01_06755 [Rickettsiales bacterium]|nr:hypothetical protein [Rickettsiales bacterium]